MTLLRVISAQLVHSLLPMNDCIELMGVAMAATTSGEAIIPPRQFTRFGDDNAVLVVMPGGAIGQRVYGVKVLSLHPYNADLGKPTIQGFVALFDAETGEPLAIVDGASITALRTAAASGLATKLLARENARTHGIFGAGVQGLMHVEAILAARPNIEQTIIWARDKGKAEQCARHAIEKTGANVIVTDDPEVVANADVVSTVTRAAAPILHGKWLQPGTHINAVGSHSAETRELDTDAIVKSSVWVDMLESAEREAGDIIIPIRESAFSASAICGEIGEISGGQKTGRRSESEITLYKSLGVVSQDIYAAWYVYNNAIKENSGDAIML